MPITSRPNLNAFAGIHKPRRDGATQFESFEVFYLGRKHPDKRPTDPAGWYWRPLPTPDVFEPEYIGPFTSSRAAFRNALKQG